jgi:hypothetical protein
MLHHEHLGAVAASHIHGARPSAPTSCAFQVVLIDDGTIGAIEKEHGSVESP